MTLVDEARASLSKSGEVSCEMARLYFSFNGYIHDTPTRDNEVETSILIRAAQEAAHGQELIKICNHLEMGGAMQDLLDDTSDHTEVELNVQGELARAWARDQAAMLIAHAEVLEKVCYL